MQYAQTEYEQTKDAEESRMPKKLICNFEEMLRLAEKQNSKPRRKPPSEEEHHTQCQCVQWFRYQYPHLAKNLFAIPNGGKRNKATAGKLKAEGVLAGVLDLMLLVPVNGCGGLLIETKTEKGTLTDAQKEWIKHMSQFGYICVLVRSLDDFMADAQNYLSGDFDKLNRL